MCFVRQALHGMDYHYCQLNRVLHIIVKLYMKNLLLGFLLFSTCSLTAQITITEASLLEVGDTLRVQNDFLVDDISVTAAGPDQDWDFTSLTSGVINESIVRDPSEGIFAAQFPSANLLINLTDSVENYLLRSSTQVADLGFRGRVSGADFLDVTAKYEVPYITQRADVSYEQEFNQSTELVVPAAYEDLPDSLLSELPNGIVFDSIRFRIFIDQTSIIDAWGTVALPGADYEVLRETVVEMRDTRVEIKLGIFPWLDAGSALEDVLPGLIGQDTSYTQQFLAEGVKEPIARITTDGAGSALTVTYKSEDIITSTVEIDGDLPDVFVYPNPAIDKIKVSLKNLSGNFTFRVFDVLGQDVYRREHLFNAGDNVIVDISHLSRGTYYYSVLTAEGKPMRTKRLMVIRP